jgi:hypothetical protein
MEPLESVPVYSDDIASLIADDEAYQAASIAFYRRDYADALLRYRRLADDRRSIDRPAASYMVARILVDTRDDDGVDAINAILADNSLAEVHGIATALRNSVAFDSGDPELLSAQFRSMLALLEARTADLDRDPDLRERWAAAVDDLWWFIGSQGRRRETVTAAALDGSDLADWLLSIHDSTFLHSRWHRSWFQGLLDPSPPSEQASHALGKWRRGFGLQWAVAAARFVEPNDETAKHELLALYRDISDHLRDCSATLAERAIIVPLRDELVRLFIADGPRSIGGKILVEGMNGASSGDEDTWGDALLVLIGLGRLDEARDLLTAHDRLLGRGSPYFGAYEIAAARILLARNLGEMYGPLPAAEGRSNAIARVLELMPIRALAAFADDPAPSASGEAIWIAWVAWVRANLLGQDDIARRLYPKVVSYSSDLAIDLKAINDTWFRSEREHRLLVAFLRFPQIGIHVDASIGSRGWYGCSLDPDASLKSLVETIYDEPIGLTNDHLSADTIQKLEAIRATYLDNNPLIKLIDRNELAQLALIPNGPKYLTTKAIEWAEQTSWYDRWLGRDRDLPEALHRAVRLTRYGCEREGGHGAYSQRAFQIVHRRYPDSEWTRKTPYWFDHTYQPGER